MAHVLSQRLLGGEELGPRCGARAEIEFQTLPANMGAGIRVLVWDE